MYLRWDNVQIIMRKKPAIPPRYLKGASKIVLSTMSQTIAPSKPKSQNLSLTLHVGVMIGLKSIVTNLHNFFLHFSVPEPMARKSPVHTARPPTIPVLSHRIVFNPMPMQYFLRASSPYYI